MNRVLSIATALLLSVLITAGCSNKKADEQALRTVIQKNLKALQDENLGDYLSTLHPESPGYAKMEMLCPKIFEIYELKHDLVNTEVLNISDNEARVRTTQEARRISGPENYRDNRSITVHTLKKYEGEWKLFKTEDESMELLE